MVLIVVQTTGSMALNGMVPLPCQFVMFVTWNKGLWEGYYLSSGKKRSSKPPHNFFCCYGAFVVPRVKCSFWFLFEGRPVICIDSLSEIFNLNISRVRCFRNEKVLEIFRLTRQHVKQRTGILRH